MLKQCFPTLLLEAPCPACFRCLPALTLLLQVVAVQQKPVNMPSIEAEKHLKDARQLFYHARCFQMYVPERNHERQKRLFCITRGLYIQSLGLFFTDKGSLDLKCLLRLKPFQCSLQSTRLQSRFRPTLRLSNFPAFTVKGKATFI